MVRCSLLPVGPAQGLECTVLQLRHGPEYQELVGEREARWLYSTIRDVGMGEKKKELISILVSILLFYKRFWSLICNFPLRLKKQDKFYHFTLYRTSACTDSMEDFCQKHLNIRV